MIISLCNLYLVFSLIIVASDKLQYVEKQRKSCKSLADKTQRLLKNQVRQLSVRVLRKCGTAWHLKNHVNAHIMCKLSLTVGLFLNQVTPRLKWNISSKHMTFMCAMI